MDVIYASLISISVIVYQVVFGVIQVIGSRIAGKPGLLIVYVLILLWTLAKTFSGLFFLQIIVQSSICYYLYINLNEGAIED